MVASRARARGVDGRARRCVPRGDGGARGQCDHPARQSLGIHPRAQRAFPRKRRGRAIRSGGARPARNRLGLVRRLQVRLFEGLRPLSRAGSVRDALAGVNLACIDVAQVLGYARIAGMPVVTGLYTLLLPAVAFALFGSSRHLVVAADSATAAILASSLSLIAAPSSAHYISLVGALALITAAMLLLARLFKLGFLADFLSRTVLSGFLAGVGAQVAIAMLGDMLGIAETSRNSLMRVWQVLSCLAGTSTLTLSLSAAVIAAILLGKRFAPRWPVPLAAIIAAIVASQAYHFAARGIAVLGPLAGGLPASHLPEATWNEILGL